MEFKDVNSLLKAIQEKVSSTLLNEVAEKVRDVEQEMIDKDVYAVYNVIDGEQYEPFEHKRRRDHGGLKDRSTMVGYVTESNNSSQLEVINEAKGDQDTSLYIAPLVEYGDSYGEGYDYKTNRTNTADQYLSPRPFKEDTVKELQQTGEHIQALKQGLIKRGLNVK
jgi:hypothetical protein